MRRFDMKIRAETWWTVAGSDGTLYQFFHRNRNDVVCDVVSAHFGNCGHERGLKKLTDELKTLWRNLAKSQGLRVVRVKVSAP